MTSDDRKVSNVKIANDSVSTSNMRLPLELLKKSVSTANMQSLTTSKPITSATGQSGAAAPTSNATPQGSSSTKK